MHLKQRISAIPFISHSEHHGFRVHPQSIELLETLPANSECSILSIVGKAKTGKSYLLNHLLPLLSE